jgi:hypothetical protein
MRQKLKLAVAAPFLAALLSACDPGTTAVVAGASLVTLAHTDKTLGDHVATWAFDKDCSTLSLANGEDYCREHVSEAELAAAEAEARAKREATYCYRTLGAVNCFKQADELASANLRVR